MLFGSYAEEEVFLTNGDVQTLLDKMIPTTTPSYRRVRSGLLGGDNGDSCSNVVVDLGIVLDVSNSSEAFLNDIASFFEDFASEATDKVRRVGLATHVDKPIPLAGYTDQQSLREDYCLQIDRQLGPLEDFDIEKVLEKVVPGGGNDYREGGFDAIARAASAFHFEKNAKSDKGQTVVNVVWLLSGSLPHLAGDAFRYVTQYNKLAPKRLQSPKKFDSSIDFSKEPNKDCATLDYPAYSDVSEILGDKAVTVWVTPIKNEYPKSLCKNKSAEECNWAPLIELARKRNDKKFIRPNGLTFGWADHLSNVDHWTAVISNVDMGAIDAFNGFSVAMEKACENGKQSTLLKSRNGLLSAAGQQQVSSGDQQPLKLDGGSMDKSKATFLIGDGNNDGVYHHNEVEHKDNKRHIVIPHKKCSHEGCHKGCSSGECHGHKKIDISIDIESF